MSLLIRFIQSETDEFHKNNVRLLISGDLSRLSKTLQSELVRVMKLTENNKRLIVNVALNYGSRAEILRAVKNIAENYKKDKIKLNQINEKMISKNLYNGEIMPDPDLLIRTSGEYRISNFLLWQIAYTEFYFTDTTWPDFSKSKLEKAIDYYYKRDRRFGGL